jgi:hypothetical protein
MHRLRQWAGAPLFAETHGLEEETAHHLGHVKLDTRRVHHPIRRTTGSVPLKIGRGPA